MSVGVADPIFETFRGVMRSSICNTVYDRVARRAFKHCGEWILNEDDGISPWAAEESTIPSNGLERLDLN